jgi:hypothetical protein
MRQSLLGIQIRNTLLCMLFAFSDLEGKVQREQFCKNIALHCCTYLESKWCALCSRRETGFVKAGKVVRLFPLSV